MAALEHILGQEKPKPQHMERNSLSELSFFSNFIYPLAPPPAANQSYPAEGERERVFNTNICTMNNCRCIELNGSNYVLRHNRTNECWKTIAKTDSSVISHLSDSIHTIHMLSSLINLSI